MLSKTQALLESWSGREVVLYVCKPMTKDRDFTGVISSRGGGWGFQVRAPCVFKDSLRVRDVVLFYMSSVVMLRFADDRDVDAKGRRLGPASDRWYPPEIWLDPDLRLPDMRMRNAPE